MTIDYYSMTIDYYSMTIDYYRKRLKWLFDRSSTFTGSFPNGIIESISGEIMQFF